MICIRSLELFRARIQRFSHSRAPTAVIVDPNLGAEMFPVLRPRCLARMQCPLSNKATPENDGWPETVSSDRENSAQVAPSSNATRSLLASGKITTLEDFASFRSRP